MWRCCKKSDATVEFLDLCMDGMIEEVMELYHKKDNDEECKEYQVTLLTSKDEHSLRTCLHLVCYRSYSSFRLLSMAMKNCVVLF